MARNPATFAKRQRELQKQQKRKEKAKRRAIRKQEKDMTTTDAPPGIDPDIAGIVPGPQPIPWADELDAE